MAGFFGFFDYTKEGKGIAKDEPEKKRFFRFFDVFGRKFWKLIQLNFLYLVFCIPIVTIGPATAAMTFICREMASEKMVFMASDFWDAFKANFKQSFLYGILSTAIFVAAFNAILFYIGSLSTGIYMYFLLGVVLTATIIFTNMNFYVYLMIVTINLKLRAILKNAFIFTFLGFKANIVTFIVIAAMTFLCVWYFPISIIAMLVCVFSFGTFLITFNSYQYIEKYIITPYYEAQKAENGETVSEDESIFSDKIIEPER